MFWLSKLNWNQTASMCKRVTKFIRPWNNGRCSTVSDALLRNGVFACSEKAAETWHAVKRSTTRGTAVFGNMVFGTRSVEQSQRLARHQSSASVLIFFGGPSCTSTTCVPYPTGVRALLGFPYLLPTQALQSNVFHGVSILLTLFVRIRGGRNQYKSHTLRTASTNQHSNCGRAQETVCYYTLPLSTLTQQLS